MNNTTDTTAYEKRLAFEHELINQRLTWLLTSQGLLFAAYAFAVEKSQDKFLLVLPKLGIAVSILLLIGVGCGFIAKIVLWRKQNKDKEKCKDWEPLGPSTVNTFIALLVDMMLPVIFAIAWYHIM